MPVEPASSPSGVFLLSEAFSFEKAPEQVPSELPKVSETFLICPLMLGPTSAELSTSGLFKEKALPPSQLALSHGRQNRALSEQTGIRLDEFTRFRHPEVLMFLGIRVQFNRHRFGR